MKTKIIVCFALLFIASNSFADVPNNVAQVGGTYSGSFTNGAQYDPTGIAGNISNSNQGSSQTNYAMPGIDSTKLDTSNSILGSDVNEANNGIPRNLPTYNNLSQYSKVVNKPLIPDQFQQDVAIRTGLSLQKYGYDLFNTPNTYVPLENTPPSSNYILGPGDQISIRAWGAVDIQYNADIDKEGGIYLPKVGRISLIGVRVGDLDGYLKIKIGRIYKNFSLSATVSKIRSIQVVVAGFAQMPGTYTISSLATLTDAIFASGGPSSEGSLRHIELKRNGLVVADYDMYDLLLKGDNSSDVHLLPGDIIYIKPHGAEVAIYDGVKIPGIYEVRKNETVSDVIKFAGGYTYNNTKKDIIVEKIDDRSQINVLTFKFADGLKNQLEGGELIHFFKMPNRYDKTVILIGNVANPSRYEWESGIRVKDIIPDKKFLLTTSFWNSYSYNAYSKDNIKEKLGAEKTTNFGDVQDGKSRTSTIHSSLAGESKPDAIFSQKNNLFTAGPISIPEADISWHYAVIIRINPMDYTTSLIPFDLAKALESDPSNNLLLKPGDIINIVSSKDVKYPTENFPIYVFIDGEVNNPGVYQLAAGSKLLDAINAANGISNKAYLYGIELDRDSVRKKQKFELGQMLDNAQQSLLSQANNSISSSINSDSVTMKNQILAQQQAFIDKMRQLEPTGRILLNIKPDCTNLKNIPNIDLENGDSINIPPIPNTVDVIGQVYNPATFIFDDKANVNDYLDKAGTPNQFADTSSIYVLRANGTLYSKHQAGWFGVFGGASLNPGDSIVVPQKIEFDSFTKNLMDWSQILANFGLGVAAVKQIGS